MRTVSLIGVLSFAVAGCATAALCPAHGGPPWREVTSEHFIVQTDLAPDEAEKTARMLERLRQAEWIELGGVVDPPGRTHVIVFSDRRALNAFGDTDKLGFTVSTSGEKLMVITTPTATELSLFATRETQTLAHELAHQLSAYLYPRQPRWVAEGLAGYLETVELSADGQSASVGLANPEYLGTIRRYGPDAISDLWAWSLPGDRAARLIPRGSLYPSAWAWVHFLRTIQRARFEAFLQALTAGAKPLDAWASSFPDEVLAGSRVAVGRAALAPLEPKSVALPVRPIEMTSRDLTDADYHALWAELWTVGPVARGMAPERAGRIAEELNQALAADPHQLLARSLQLEGLRGEARVAAARALEADFPDNPTALLLAYQSLRRGGAARAETDALFARAEKLPTDDTRVLDMLAWGEILRGDPEAARPRVTAALLRAPWNPYNLGTGSMLAWHDGRCAEAIDLAERAELYNENRPLPGLDRRIERIRASCHEGVPQGSTSAESLSE